MIKFASTGARTLAVVSPRSGELVANLSVTDMAAVLAEETPEALVACFDQTVEQVSAVCSLIISTQPHAWLQSI